VHFISSPSGTIHFVTKIFKNQQLLLLRDYEIFYVILRLQHDHEVGKVGTVKNKVLTKKQLEELPHTHEGAP
jgi:hypothetical protein